MKKNKRESQGFDGLREWESESSTKKNKKEALFLG